MKKYAKITAFLALGAVYFGLTSCATGDNSNNQNPADDFSNTPACQNNAFLKKYNCSLDQVEEAAEEGEPDAEYALGYMYYYGIEAEQDQPTAMVWIKRAAEQGQPLAIKALGLLEHKNYTRGVKAAPVSQTNSGDTASFGDGTADVASDATSAAPAVMHHAVPGRAAPAKTMAFSSAPLPQAAASIKRIPASHYTIQLMGSSNAKAIEQFAVANHLKGHSYMYRMTLRGKPFYVLIDGNYPTMAAANAAKDKLPAKLKAQQPWVKSFKVVHSQMK